MRAVGKGNGKQGGNSSPPAIAIVGMGCVGLVSAASLATRGFRVVGVESGAARLAALRAGRCPFREPGLQALVATAIRDGNFEVTGDLAIAVCGADVVVVAVGTPSGREGDVDLTAIQSVTGDLAAAIAADGRPRTIVIRSTVPPGTVRGAVAPVIHGVSPQSIVCHHPEFLREGSAVADWNKPSMIVWGAESRDAAAVGDLMERLYRGVPGPRVALGLAESELMKYASNTFHALKITFANEIGSIARACGADARSVMDAFCSDAQLNVSRAYLRPGLPFGGSCLPKDTRGLAAVGRALGVATPLLDAILPSNASHLDRVVQHILNTRGGRTVLVGVTFKSGTDDVRDSALLALAERLIDAGVGLAIWDPDLDPTTRSAELTRLLHNQYPHIDACLCDSLDEALLGAQRVLLAKPLAITTAQAAGREVIDLVGAPSAPFVATQSVASINPVRSLKAA